MPSQGSSTSSRRPAIDTNLGGLFCCSRCFASDTKCHLPRARLSAVMRSFYQPRLLPPTDDNLNSSPEQSHLHRRCADSPVSSIFPTEMRATNILRQTARLPRAMTGCPNSSESTAGSQPPAVFLSLRGGGRVERHTLSRLKLRLRELFQTTKSRVTGHFRPTGAGKEAKPTRPDGLSTIPMADTGAKTITSQEEPPGSDNPMTQGEMQRPGSHGMPCVPDDHTRTFERHGIEERHGLPVNVPCTPICHRCIDSCPCRRASTIGGPPASSCSVPSHPLGPLFILREQGPLPRGHATQAVQSQGGPSQDPSPYPPELTISDHDYSDNEDGQCACRCCVHASVDVIDTASSIQIAPVQPFRAGLVNGIHVPRNDSRQSLASGSSAASVDTAARIPRDPSSHIQAIRNPPSRVLHHWALIDGAWATEPRQLENVPNHQPMAGMRPPPPDDQAPDLGSHNTSQSSRPRSATDSTRQRH
ncbi:hypothetical protein BDY21DRAFT_3440 [Lineolata rhizophorae]|uniref:Uncharacterized protein n=1 Tax=Lineolata rhizophorae TaxID=578093 RepID=A0A6A6PES2_9PEZI|nr:hypothetical protein BDY21DRAFT_3440 [Lineolata rhizophorae]